MNKKSLVNNWISFFGFVLGCVFLFVEALLIIVDYFYPSHNPYTGILIYVAGPSLLVMGLLLVPIGMFFEARHRKKYHDDGLSLIVDFNQPRHRRYAIIFLAVTVPFLALSMLGTYRAYHVTESVEFCGTLCHQVMTPEYVAYQNSAHARLQCTKCHIGPGADWFVKSKLSGAWQVYAVLTSSYSLPIETPVHNLRPARDTCEQCHWPEKFTGNVERTRTHYGSDDENTPYRVVLSMKVGGGHPEHGHVGGIHWHVSSLHKVEYLATDEDRLDIPYVRVTYKDGRVEEFKNEAAQELGEIKEEDLREMDCIDCHNRPSHVYRSPAFAVDRAMDLGKIDPKLPGIKSLTVDLIGAEYETQNEAVEAIGSGLKEALAGAVEADPALAPALEKSIAEAQDLYRENIFPEWKVSWEKYPDHSGHFRFPGCYRCHDDMHETSDGKTISNDCNLCHEVIGQAEGWDAVESMTIAKQDFIHPREMEGVEQGTNCTDCHGAI